MTPEPIQYPKKVRELQCHLLDSTVWNEFEFRSDDIIIASYSKSGTTWVQQIVAQLLWQGAEHLNVAEMSPWLDCRFPSHEEKLAVVAAQTHRRFIKSHLPVDALVFSPQAKYIYVGRDGRDVLWSTYHHHLNMKPDVVQSIDAAPGRVGPPLGYAPESVLQYFRDWLTKDGYPWWPFWEHVLSWWRIRDLPNVMLLHFADLKADMPAEIRRTAAFLDIPIDESTWETIIEHCTFDYMKAHGARSVPFSGDLWEGGAKTFMHKGVNGRWRDVLTPEDVARYERTANERLGAKCAHWLAHGSSG
ncbi:MAG: sulfotransferase domain-containing protein [Anaerolineae bacterium]|nr:sulfotransferase domain-containing protein [Anaerolineae bacterium]